MRFLSFPNPVNEYAARTVAAGVVVLALITLIFQLPWLTVPIAYGFIARVASGPRFSPLGQLATRVIAPRLPWEPKLVAGPPKRFAQGIGAVVTTTAAILAVGFGADTAAYVLVGIILVFATLESALGLCVGCKIFAVLMRVGVIPPEVCESCNNIWTRSAPSTTV
jgi:hypothetical protein